MGRWSLKALLLTTSLTFTAHAQTKGSGPVLFELKGKTYTSKDLSASAQQSIYESEKAQYETLTRAINAAIIDVYLAERAQSEKTTVEKLSQQLFKTDVTEKTAKAWYDQNKQRLAGREFATIKDELITYLTQEEEEKVRNRFVSKIKKDLKFTSRIKEPEIPHITINTDLAATIGSQTAKVQVVEFADYQCPHCADAHPIMMKIKDKYKNKIRFSFMHFPLRQEGIAATVAAGAVCAQAQGKFWEYHDLAFKRQPTLTPSSPKELAKELKLDTAAFDKCFDAPEAKSKVTAMRAEGERVGVMGTPSVYVNGRRAENFSFDALSSLIDAAL